MVYFCKDNLAPKGRKRSLFATTQESTRKDVERAFGVLQARFAIVVGLHVFGEQRLLITL